MSENHVGLIPILIASFLLMLPSYIFYRMDYGGLGFFYEFVLVFMLISAISNLKWPREINTDWMKSLSKKHIKVASKKAN